MKKDKLLEEYKAYAPKHVDEFKSLYTLDVFPKVLDGPGYGGAIIYSEGYAICSLVEFFKVNKIIESGICNGGSTRMLYSYFKDKDVSMISIERDKIRDDLINDLSSKVTFARGLSQEVIPKALETETKVKDARIGVVLDGPKREAAIKLANQCLQYPEVKFVLIHDMCKKNKERYGNELVPARLKMENMPNALFFTDSDWYVDTFKHLDINKGFETRYSSFGSYSFTFGCLVNPNLI